MALIDVGPAQRGVGTGSGVVVPALGGAMHQIEILHAAPLDGDSASPCCGRALAQLPRYERIVRDDAQVTCGRLSEADALLLSGQPVIEDDNHEQVVFAMAVAVAALSGGTVSLPTAHAKLGQAIRETVPAGRPLVAWSAALMVTVTARAQELAVPRI